MSGFLSEDVHMIIEGFLGIHPPYKKGYCHAISKKGYSCATKTSNRFMFCKKHQNLIKKLGNGNELKEIAISYLLRVYKGPNRKKITSKGIDISKRVQEIPIWVHLCPNYFFITTEYNVQKELFFKKRNDKIYCMCPWCIEQYFKLYNKYVERIIMIKRMIDENSYPYNSIIELFNNNILKINESIKKKKKSEWKDCLIDRIIPKKRLLYQYLNYYSEYPKDKFEIVFRSFWKREKQLDIGYRMYSSYVLSRLKFLSSKGSIAHYEIVKLLTFKECVKKSLPDKIIKNIFSYFYGKKSFSKSFLYRKRIIYFKLPNEWNKWKAEWIKDCKKYPHYSKINWGVKHIAYRDRW
tara:strand:- start:4137 stop:5189 length:1053 start_codon:yes stop_codon:yes gene_type:complete